ADERRAPHLHGLDGARRVLERLQSYDPEIVRQQRLVDDVDRPPVAGQPDGTVGNAVDLHAALLVRRDGYCKHQTILMPSKVSRPRDPKIAAAASRTQRGLIRSPASWPQRTAGTSAISMPAVVPMTTDVTALKRAANATVAICVLSPISARKKLTVVTRKALPAASLAAPLLSSVSGTSAQAAMPRKSAPRPQRSRSGVIALPSHWPRRPARL